MNLFMPKFLFKPVSLTKRLLPAIALLSIATCLGIAWVLPPDPLDKIISQLNSFRQNYPQEKIYLQLDKPFYVTGDTLYFKTYLVNAEKNEPGGVSGIVHLDILDQEEHLLKNILLKMQDGVAWGSIPLDTLFRGGSYRFRYYTNWMRNFDPTLVPEKNILIKTLLPAKALPQQTIAASATVTPSIQLFPEGGQLVEQLAATVGFICTNSQGRGIPCTGRVVDDHNQTVASFSSAFAGIGRFSFTPFPGKKYEVEFSLPDGTVQRKPLPPAIAEGLSLSIDNSDREWITIKIAGNQRQLSNDYILIAQCNQVLQLVAKNNTGATGILAKLSRNRFPTGIVQFTLFDALYRPVAERLVFNNLYDSAAIILTTPAREATKRSKMEWTLELESPNGESLEGNFAVAVTNTTKVKDDASMGASIESDLLLQSDIRGRIQDPQHYFSDTTRQLRLELDNLLLTQGWRRFTWNDLVRDKQPNLAFEAEQERYLSGTIQDDAGHPIPGATIQLLLGAPENRIVDTVANSAGKFRIPLPPVANELRYVIEAKDPQQHTAGVVVPDTAVAFATNSTTPPKAGPEDSAATLYQGYAREQLQSFKRYGGLITEKGLLKEVVVKAAKNRKPTERELALEPSMNLNGPGNADQVLTYLDLQNCHTLEMCLQGKLRGVFIKSKLTPKGPILLAYSSLAFGKPMRVYRDGVEMPNEDEWDLRNFSAADIQSVEVLRSGGFTSVYGTKGANGILLFTTKKGGLDYNLLGNKSGATPTSYKAITGYYQSREFYSPQYDTTAVSGKTDKADPDWRTTVYWSPQVVTDEQGKASFSYFNNDLPGKYRVLLEGITHTGRLIRKIAYYEVR